MNTEGHGQIWTIVVAAGAGSRFGAPKQFLDLSGVRVVDRSVQTAARHSDGVVVVAPAEPPPGVVPVESPGDIGWAVVRGGSSRAASVRNGLAAVPMSASFILVHDAARPLASDMIYERVIEELKLGADAVTPVVPVTDTIRHRSGAVVDRNELSAVQTPQGFRALTLRAAHASGAEATDDVTLVERVGGSVELVDGDPRNLKLTTPADLELAASYLSGGAVL